MIKVFLVEDEYAIREGIKKSVNWEQNGFELVGEAGDGEVAFPKIMKTEPDILITDIRMPFMDGLELSRLVKKEMPNIRIIVLSGYDDFNYAKQAISIGVEEYILKPVSGESLMSELLKISDDIEKDRRENEAKAKYQKDREEIRILERSMFIRDMIDGRLSMQESLERGRELGIDVTAAFYCIVLIQVFPRKIDSGVINEYSGVNEEIYGRLKELYNDENHVYVYEQIGDILCLLEKADAIEELESNIEKGLGELKSIMQDYKDKIYFASVGKIVERIRDVNMSYADASRHFAERYMFDDSFVFNGNDNKQKELIRQSIADERRISTDEVYADTENKDIDINKLDINKLDTSMISRKTIYNFLRSGTTSEIDDLVNEYFESIGEEATRSVMFRQYVLVEALISSVSFLEELGVSKDKSSEILGELSNPINYTETRDSSKQYIRNLLVLMIEYRNRLSDKKYNEIIDKAKSFIQDNYQNDDMSLQTVASSVNVSSNHFSAIFRKETGETFIDYLTAVRINKAKELLTCTSMKTSEIGFEVGYRDPHYFSFIFKKIMGMSPKEYRRIKKES